MYRRRSDRALSTIIGAVLVAVILLGLLTMYQVYGVPAENEAIEFEHSQGVRGDVLDVRNALLDAKRSGATTAATVDLAPSYPTRLIAINPPPPSGTLRTGENGSVSVLEEGATAVDVCPVAPETRPITYEGQYNVYADGPTMRIENTVAYADFDGVIRPISEQQLVQGDRVDLLLVQNEYRESGGGVASIEPRPGRIRERRVDDPTVTVPTALDEATWESFLDGEVPADAVTVAGGELTLDLAGTHSVSCGVVSARGTPPGGMRHSAGERGLNPAGPGNLELVDAEALGGGGGPGGGPSTPNVTVTFENNASEQLDVTEARIAFYYQTPDNRDAITEADLFASPTPGVDERATLVVRAPLIGLDGPIAFDPGVERTVSMTFDVTVDQGDFLVLEVTFADGQRARYAVGLD